ncbi:hypothetical protein CEXT_768821 [Caerostris extrusa]|uniref:Uncharacterized protein n=1 Tax=Caerostris extrusa TaxID=172846 RepID=A0AAV4XLV5_CAEEX|nr:hypothetical protein CEXT_768821 [Caerostris extrusa]
MASTIVENFYSAGDYNKRSNACCDDGWEVEYGTGNLEGNFDVVFPLRNFFLLGRAALILQEAAVLHEKLYFCFEGDDAAFNMAPSEGTGSKLLILEAWWSMTSALPRCHAFPVSNTAALILQGAAVLHEKLCFCFEGDDAAFNTASSEGTGINCLFWRFIRRFYLQRKLITPSSNSQQFSPLRNFFLLGRAALILQGAAVLHEKLCSASKATTQLLISSEGRGCKLLILEVRFKVKGMFTHG